MTLVISGCSRNYQISHELPDGIKTPEQFYNNQTEIIYLETRGDQEIVDKLFRLVPMVTKDDCTCLASEPEDLSAIIVAREYEIDKNLRILETVRQQDRNLANRYLMAAPPQDFDPNDKTLVNK